MRPLQSLPGGTYSEAMWINQVGQIVGLSGSSLGTRAVLWNADGTVVDLNEHIIGNTALVLTGAFAIDDKGQIAAYGVLRPGSGHHQPADLDQIHAGPTRAVLLIPE